MIEGAVVIGDLMRPHGDGTPGEVDRMTLWLCNAVKRSIFLAANLPVEALTTVTSMELRSWIDLLRAPRDADAFWASVHAQLPWSPALERLVLQRLRGRFCIGYEMPPWLVRLLEENELPYMDLRLHPVRFHGRPDVRRPCLAPGDTGSPAVGCDYGK